LVRKEGSIGRRDLVGPWLYGVAYRTAVRARANAAKRRCRELQAGRKTEADPVADLDWRDLRPILDEEVQRLPEKYRVPFILCHLEGKSNEEAARLLGCPKGTILSRLARARELLRYRLTRRGLTYSVAGLAVLLAQQAARAAVPVMLMDSTLKTAPPMLAGQMVGTGPVSAPVFALVQGELRSMFLSKLFVTVSFLLGMGIGGVGVFGYRVAAPAAPADPQPVVTGAESDKNRVTVPSRVDGTLMVLGTEIKEGDQLPIDAIITLKVGTETKKYRRLQKGDSVEAGQLLGVVDDRLARNEVAIKEAKLKGAGADQEAALKIKEEAMARYKTQERLFGNGGGGNRLPATSIEDLRAAKLMAETRHLEWVSKGEAVKQAEAELELARTLVEMHEIRSPARGVIKDINKYQGEAVRKLEPVLVIQLSRPRK